jgi:uncharacterized damage-inducible protein DinB
VPRFPGPRCGRPYELQPIGIDLFDDFDQLRAARHVMDADLTVWAAALRDDDLRGDLTWYSTVAQREMRRPLMLCVAQMFNHQTHHRGQVTTLLTQLGQDVGSTDLPWAPFARDAGGRIVLGEEFAL